MRSDLFEVFMNEIFVYWRIQIYKENVYQMMARKGRSLD